MDIRAEVVEMAQEAERQGLIKYKSGNFSVRDKYSGYIYITPSGIARRNLLPEMISVLDQNGKILSSPYMPSVEYLMHVKIYQKRDDVYAICHSHSLYATTFAIAGMEIPPVSREAVHYGAITIPVADYAKPGTEELADNVVKALQGYDCCLLKSHGVVTVGENAEDAIIKLIYVEENAKEFFNLTLLGAKFQPISL
jgi:Class II Aldolase and Adducin N-terminal domain.